MATVRQHFETDFTPMIRLCGHFEVDSLSIEARMICDFAAFVGFMSVYIAGLEHALPYYLNILRKIQHGQSQFFFNGNILLPGAWEFPGEMQVFNDPNDFKINVRFHGAACWRAWTELPTSTRLFIYSEAELPEQDILRLELQGHEFGHNVQFRSPRHVMKRTQFEKPVAFISHDSRDDEIARKIAIGMQQHRCSVWYDEFTLRAGDNLRDNIEKGLKECHKCIIVLSNNFFSNGGWTKREFDSIFTREIL
jgi:TIR domain